MMLDSSSIKEVDSCLQWFLSLRSIASEINWTSARRVGKEGVVIFVKTCSLKLEALHFCPG